ncbi:hypothetical protein HJC23_012411 [Cyclotella cryptica]|uniref:Secreted protein n=1 Tax=Cyclotella cryptica TaxID=29204 RepID=A0ABD3Q446_9STRA
MPFCLVFDDAVPLVEGTLAYALPRVVDECWVYSYVCSSLVVRCEATMPFCTVFDAAAYLGEVDVTHFFPAGGRSACD